MTGRRVLALAVDLLGMGLVAFLVRGLVGGLWAGAPAAGGGVLLDGTDLLVAAGWFALVPAAADGRTVGQRTLALRVVTLAGRRPGVGRLLLRSAVLLLPVYVCDRVARGVAGTGAGAGGWLLAAGGVEAAVVLGQLAVVLGRPDRRGLHDLAAGTRVLDAA